MVAKMYMASARRSVGQITAGRSIDLPDYPGVYAFWWIGSRSKLLRPNPPIVLKGPGERPVEVEYKEWWPKALVYPCLYVGKSTNIRKRFSLHLKRGSPG